jgi:virginiamycin B lyase
MRYRYLYALAVPGAVALCAWAQQPGADFPEGPGKAYVIATCGSCHDINRLKAGYTPAGWRTVMQMMHNMDVVVPPDQQRLVTDYLIKSFPERERPPAVLVDGPAKADIRLFTVPTPDSRPHDPAAGRDGAIWYAAQTANKLGRVDPKSGKITEFSLKVPHSGPHGLTEDRSGNIWFTANNAGYIGRLDPKTGGVTELKLPDPAARDPHTLVFDRDGILWFTVQQANKVGRLDPKSGEIKLVASPTAKSRPYGMAVSAKNEVWFVEFGANKIATIDRATMQIREFTLPDPAARPRRIAIGPDDIVWYTDFARGYLGRLDPETGTVTEWPSPSGPKAEPYGIVFTRGAVWYSESFAKPNTLVRFDPGTRRFQTWAIPGGGDIVRNMDVTAEGDVLLANSLVNEVALVMIGR